MLDRQHKNPKMGYQDFYIRMYFWKCIYKCRRNKYRWFYGKLSTCLFVWPNVRMSSFTKSSSFFTRLLGVFDPYLEFTCKDSLSSVRPFRCMIYESWHTVWLLWFWSLYYFFFSHQLCQIPHLSSNLLISNPTILIRHTMVLLPLMYCVSWTVLGLLECRVSHLKVQTCDFWCYNNSFILWESYVTTYTCL